MRRGAAAGGNRRMPAGSDVLGGVAGEGGECKGGVEFLLAAE